MDVIFIGTGDAFGAGGRRQAAILLRSREGTLLLDCGATTGVGLAALGICRDSIDAIVVSHFHADHFGGIPLLLLAALHEDDRRRPLHIAGPVGIERRVLAAAQALGHPFHDARWPFRLSFEEFLKGADSAVGSFRVVAFEAHHAPDACPHGLQITADSRRVVYTGDTGWFDALPDRARGADLFICECTLHERGFPHHLSLEELSAHRERFECRRMVLTHLGPEMRDREVHGFEKADDGLTIALG